MKRKIALLLSVILLLSLFVGCVNKGDDQQPTILSSKPTTQPTTTTTTQTPDNKVTLSADKQEYQIHEPITLTCNFPGQSCVLTVYYPHGSSDNIAHVGDVITLSFGNAGLYSAYITYEDVQSNTIIFVVKDDQQSTTQPTTQPTTGSTGTSASTKPGASSTSTVKNPCTKGHTYLNGFCTKCAAADPNYNFCAKGHSYKNGFCSYCGAVDPNYDPCANGHTYKNGWCIYCLASDPNYNPCVDGHTFENGYCVWCLAADPDYDPCAKGHTYSYGKCIYCQKADPYYNPCAYGHNYSGGVCKNCGSSAPGTGDNSTLEEEYGATLKIIIPGHNSKDATAWQNKVVSQFKAYYPNVTVQFVTATWSDWYEKLLAAYVSGDPIDLINDGVNNQPKFSIMGITQPLKNYINMDNPNLKIEAMEACFKYGGNYYVAASEVNYGVVFYNKDLFKAKGLEDPMELYQKGQWNWTNFVRLAKQLTNKNTDTYGFATEFPYLFYGANATATLKIDDNGNYSLNMDDPAFIAALEIIQDGWYGSGWSGWDGTAMGTFQTGKAAMLGSFTMYESDINTLAALFGWEPIDYGVVPLPYGPHNTQKLNMVHASGWAIGAGSDCPGHVGKLIDMLVDGHAAYLASQQSRLPSGNVELYREMAKKVFCVNTRDSAIGGGYELAQEVASGRPVAQAIEQFKPQYQAKIDQYNS